MIDITTYNNNILVENTYDIVFNQYQRMIFSLFIIVLYNIFLIFMIKYNKLDLEQYYTFSYYGFVANMCIVFMMLGAIL